MVAECTGTVLWERNSRTEVRPSRSSNQPGVVFCRWMPVAIAGLLGSAGDHHFLTAHFDGVLFQGRGRWTGDHFTVQVVNTVMAGAPDLLRGITELHRAVQ